MLNAVKYTLIGALVDSVFSRVSWNHNVLSAFVVTVELVNRVQWSVFNRPGRQSWFGFSVGVSGYNRTTIPLSETGRLSLKLWIAATTWGDSEIGSTLLRPLSWMSVLGVCRETRTPYSQYSLCYLGVYSMNRLWLAINAIPVYALLW